MSYNMTKEIQTEKTSGFNFIDVGIHENVELTNVRYDVSPNGNEFLAFDFQDEKGKTLSHTEWSPGDGQDSKILNQMKRVRHIVVKYIPEENFIFEAQNFKEFATKTIELLGDAYKGKKVRLKVTYNTNNWADLPNYLPFIELMDVPKEKSKLEIISIDKMQKDTQPDPVPQATNPFESGSTNQSVQTNTVSNSDDLPF